jgi:hypothetical protein
VPLSLERTVNAGADAVLKAEGRTDALHGLVQRSRRGLRTGHVHKGPPGTWEVRSFPFEIEPQGGERCEEQKPPAHRCTTERRRDRNVRVRMVPTSEGNEARREERSGVGAFHSTVEAGEFVPKETL